jgi:hypothetical protein
MFLTPSFYTCVFIPLLLNYICVLKPLSGADLGGNVEAVQNVDYFDRLTGSDVGIVVLTDGLETSAERGFAASPSVAGNEIAGTFTLTYRGHTTEAIDFNVADTVLKSKIEALPNINTVFVTRTGPSVFKEYAWSVTFLSMPGAYPDGTENLLELVPDFSMLEGTGSSVAVTVPQDGSEPLSGTFSLTMTTGDSNVTEVASNIPADASASELQVGVRITQKTSFYRPLDRNWSSHLQHAYAN